MSAAVIPLLFLAACGSTATGAGDLDDVTVGGTDQAPTVSFETKPITVKATTAKVIKAGKGATLTKANAITFSYSIFNGKDGRQIDSSFGKEPVPLDLSATTLLPGLRTGLSGQQVGSRLLLAIPPADAFGAQRDQTAAPGPGDTLIFLIDVVSASTAPTPRPTAPTAPTLPRPGS